MTLDFKNVDGEHLAKPQICNFWVANIKIITNDGIGEENKVQNN